ncbi:hypothetical protein LTR56_021784 [Elasticomyces elasticus]|nr:hypothetical protein LTR56_021784 [Elasticomyces elasticus]KAK3630540.1 hypothetical protein LTR22_021456 [Elasticomyces elasticus]KAK4909075.1 hypothetical protein LTR49_022115 [Elasticomyces elasticus]KAK5748460.1 hypothetical protein LTS12_021479 [Elasticomyces elasticus]
MAPPNVPSPYAEAHASPAGPDDARPTGTQILHDNDRVGTMSDKTFLVTGGTDGLGLETVRTLAKTGAKVFFSARNEDKAKKVLAALVEEGTTDKDLKGAKIDYVIIDNVSLKSVKSGAEDFLRKSDTLNVLINNAGIANVPHGVSEDGFESQFATNHLAHFYLFQLLRPLLLKSSTPAFNSRVVAVSSTAHGFASVQIGNYNQEKKVESGNYDPMCELDDDFNPAIAYGQSKTANIWMANEIERRYGAKGLHGLSIHPGNILTAGWGTMDPRIAEKFGAFIEMDAFKAAFKSIPQGVATQVLAAVGKHYEGKGGFYLDDCSVSKAMSEEDMVGLTGYRPWIYNPEGEKKLWADSLKMVGLNSE